MTHKKTKKPKKTKYLIVKPIGGSFYPASKKKFKTLKSAANYLGRLSKKKPYYIVESTRVHHTYTEAKHIKNKLKRLATKTKKKK